MSGDLPLQVLHKHIRGELRLELQVQEFSNTHVTVDVEHALEDLADETGDVGDERPDVAQDVFEEEVRVGHALVELAQEHALQHRVLEVAELFQQVEVVVLPRYLLEDAVHLGSRPLTMFIL